MSLRDRTRVVLLPGLLCDEAAWSSQRAALRDLADCIVPDYGSLDSLPAMAEAALQQAPGELVVVGHSMGGRVALEIVRRAPERVRALALLDTGYQPRVPGDAGERERAGRMALVDLARREGMRAVGAQWVRGMVHPARLDDATLIGAILDMIARKTAETFEAQQRALLSRPDATALLATIARPTLLLCGRDDAWSPLARHEDMARRIPHSQLGVIDDCGHMSTMERPDAVSAALRAWLTTRVTSSTTRAP